MKRVPMSIIVSSLFLLIVACTSGQTMDEEVVLPEDIPSFVDKNDFETIDWKRKAVEIGDGRIIGNENKSGVIGADMTSLNGQKWMWHLWGVKDVDLSIVGFHRETRTVHQILIDGWTKHVWGPNNGADAHLPSSVKIPKPGEWAIILYTGDRLFDILVYEINE